MTTNKSLKITMFFSFGEFGTGRGRLGISSGLSLTSLVFLKFFLWKFQKFIVFLRIFLKFSRLSKFSGSIFQFFQFTIFSWKPRKIHPNSPLPRIQKKLVSNIFTASTKELKKLIFSLVFIS